MTSPERVRAALTGVQPDRVPVVEFGVHPRVAEALVPGATDVPEAMDRLGLDGVGAWADFQRFDIDAGHYRDEWGVIYGRTVEMLDHPVKGPVTSLADLRNWQPPDPDAPHRFDTLRGVVARFKGRRAIFVHHRAAFMWSCYVAGMDRVLESMAYAPDFVAELFDKVVGANERVIRNAIRVGAEVVVVADDYAGTLGPLFSPQTFRELVLPRLQRVIDAIHDEGALAIKHTDGNIWSLLDDIVATGADGLNPLEPIADMDLARVKAHCGARICLIGNIDCGDLLSNGTVAEVEAAVRQAIRDAAPGGRYMVSSSNSIHASVKPENFREMIDATHRWGGYDTTA
jgi:uroporphyrinogen decarboxylase